jgi:hypothetical protein
MYSTMSRYQKNNASGTYSFGPTSTSTNGTDPASGNALASMLLDFPVNGNLRDTDVQYFRTTYYAWFVQDDWRLHPILTLSGGLRFETQTKVPDKVDFAPRIGVAWAVGNKNRPTVIRGGVAIFHADMDFNQSVNARRLDGRRLYEIQIDNPGWPNPYAAGSVRPRSRRVVDYPYLAETYYPLQIGFERSLPKNLFVTVNYQRIRGTRLVRSRDINAPLPGTNIRPIPEEGQIALTEHNGLSTHHHIKASMRQRFSIFNVTAAMNITQGGTIGAGGFRAACQQLRPHGDGDMPAANITINTSVNARMPLDVYLTTKVRQKAAEPTPSLPVRTTIRMALPMMVPGVPKNNVFGPHYFDVSFNFSKVTSVKPRPWPPRVEALRHRRVRK